MIEPVKITEESENELRIAWSDSTESVYTARELRVNCPCAGCIDEWTGKKLLMDEKIPADISFANISLVGRYALSFDFSDGHDTGIFSFDLLRKIGQNRLR
jgi:DUF971 family protein